MMTHEELKAVRARVAKKYGPPPYTYQKAFALALEDVTTLLAHIDAQQAIVEAVRDFVTVLQEDHDLSQPVVLPGEIDTLIDALAGEGAHDGPQSK